jgi:hypothetical protein
MQREILIRGDGVAAYCCAHLLKKAGFRVDMERPARARVPAIMLSSRAVALLRDVFDEPTLFAGASPIDRRVVAWGREAETVSVPHSAIVVSEGALIGNLARGLEPESAGSREFVVHTSKPLPPESQEHRFGTRPAVAAEVALKVRADVSTCRIESLDGGWLFLIPNAAESAWLVAVGASVESLLPESRVIAPRIELHAGRSAEFSACPGIAVPLFGTGWLACGAAALAFDPICGDGTAQAVREAVLAAAVVRALADGGDRASLFAHYETRLTGGMARHLELCADFYRSGGNGPWWQRELDGLREGQQWCAARLAKAGEPRWKLTGDVLTVYNRDK